MCTGSILRCVQLRGLQVGSSAAAKHRAHGHGVCTRVNRNTENVKSILYYVLHLLAIKLI